MRKPGDELFGHDPAAAGQLDHAVARTERTIGDLVQLRPDEHEQDHDDEGKADHGGGHGQSEAECCELSRGDA